MKIANKAFVLACVLVAFSSFGSAKIVHWINPYMHLRVDYNVEGTACDVFNFTVYGAGGRILPDVDVDVYMGENFHIRGLTDVNGAYSFIPTDPGRYTFTVKQGRYDGIGGEFSVINATDPGSCKGPDILARTYSKYPKEAVVCDSPLGSAEIAAGCTSPIPSSWYYYPYVYSRRY